MFCHRREDLGDRPRSAVQVKDYFILCASDIIPHQAVKHFRPAGIGLEERKRRYLERKSKELFIKEILSPENLCPVVMNRIGDGIIEGMQDPRDPAAGGGSSSPGRDGSQDSLCKCSKIRIRLARGDQIHQNLPCINGFPDQKMTEITLMRKSVEIREIRPPRIVQNRGKNPSEVLIHDPAVLRTDDVIKASAFMHPQRERAALIGVAECELHLIPVSRMVRTVINALEPWPVRHNSLLHHSPDLLLFQPEFRLRGKGPVEASAAVREMRAVALCLVLCAFLHFQQKAFTFRGSLPGQAKGNLLSRQSSADSDLPVLQRSDSLSRIIAADHVRLIDLSFSHNCISFFRYVLRSFRNSSALLILRKH